MKYVFLFLSLLSIAQEKIVKGVILNKETQSPIPYVNISILKSQIGTSSDEDGSYALIVKNEDHDKEVQLSSLGYKDTTFMISSFLKLKKVELSPIIELLDTVVISDKFKNEFLEINPIRKKDLYGGFGGFKDHPYTFALYLPYEESFEKTEYIHSLRVSLNKTSLFSGQPKPSKFRIRLFSVKNDSIPDKDLILKNLIVETTKKQRDAVINLSEFSIIFPEEGVFVAIEWLHIPFNAYEFTYTKGKTEKTYTETRYAPRLSWVKRKDEANRLAVFAQGQWLQFKMPYVKQNDYLIPAISLTLSN